MYTQEELAQRYTKFSDSELLALLDNSSDYTTNAIAAAQQEIKNRNLQTDRIEQYQEEKAINEQIQSERATEPLTISEKVRFFFLWFVPVVNLALRRNLKDDGFLTKVKFSKYYGILGFVSVLISVFISVVATLPTIATIVIWIALFFVTQLLERTIKNI